MAKEPKTWKTSGAKSFMRCVMLGSRLGLFVVILVFLASSSLADDMATAAQASYCDGLVTRQAGHLNDILSTKNGCANWQPEYQSEAQCQSAITYITQKRDELKIHAIKLYSYVNLYPARSGDLMTFFYAGAKDFDDYSASINNVSKCIGLSKDQMTPCINATVVNQDKVTKCDAFDPSIPN